MPPARVAALFRSAGHRAPLLALDEVRLLEGVGAEEEPKSTPGRRRQLLAVDAETLTEEGRRPGDLREQVTLEGVLVDRLPEGTLLRVGEAVVAVGHPCTPCCRMDELSPGLQERLRGRRGRFLRVVRSGLVRVGDAVLPVEDASQRLLSAFTPLPGEALPGPPSRGPRGGSP